MTIHKLNSAGIPVIPSVNYLWESDLKKYSDWLNGCGFNYVYINAQMIKSDKNFELFLGYMKKLKRRVKAKIIVVGVVDIKRIAKLNEIGKKFIYSNSMIHALSSFRLLWNPTNNYKKINTLEGMYYTDVFKRNFRNYTKKMYKVIGYERK